MDKKEFFEPEVKVVELEQLMLSNSPTGVEGVEESTDEDAG